MPKSVPRRICGVQLQLYASRWEDGDRVAMEGGNRASFGFASMIDEFINVFWVLNLKGSIIIDNG